jgi:hypothetical protein
MYLSEVLTAPQLCDSNLTRFPTEAWFSLGERGRLLFLLIDGTGDAIHRFLESPMIDVDGASAYDVKIVVV